MSRHELCLTVFYCRELTGIGFTASGGWDNPDLKQPLLRMHPDLKSTLTDAGGLFNAENQQATASEYFDLIGARDSMRDKLCAAITLAGVQCVLSPVLPFVAPPIGQVKNLGSAAGTMVYNILDVPSGVVPVCRVSASDVATEYKPRSCDTQMQTALEKTHQGSVGLPVGVQLATLPWQEELCLKAMLAVEENVPGLDESKIAAPNCQAKL